ncbi:MAG: rhodanese-like domain-containing protein [Bacteroidales bacterium]
MAQQINEFTTEQLAEWIQQPEGILLDIRPLAAYNGWPLKDEPRGGHIRGATSIPFKWTQYIDFKDIMDSKGIIPGKSLVIYGYNPENTEWLARKLKGSGFENVSVYHKFPEEWSPAQNLPIDKLERYRQLVYPEWVYRLINGEKPLGFEGNDYVICHSHYGYEQDYHDGHIPGAIPLNTNDLESKETWNRRSPEELEETLLKHGISHDTTVVVYGRFSHPDNRDPYPGQAAGHLGAIRCAAILIYAGVKDVKILNGGLSAWYEDGFETTAEETRTTPKERFGAEIPGHPEIFVDTPKAKELLKSDDGELVSIRSWEEFIGKVSGYNYIEKTGRIPGAIFGNCGSDAYHMENYRNFDHTMREFHEIEAQWRENGITSDKYIAFYCGTGWRGSEAFMNAWLIGWPRVSVYDGGWFEWSSDLNNPIEVGEPEEERTV